MQFNSKVIIITGASSGIGKQLSIDLAKKGCNVILAARNEEKLNKVLQEIKEYSKDSIAVKCDVSKHEEVKDLIERSYKKYNKIDILINNAGFGVYKEFNDTKIGEIKETLDVNYYGAIHTTKEILPIMLKQGYGHIINISSVAGRTGLPNVAAYSASKFAVIGFSESLYHELKPKNINVSVICPGAVKTNFFNAHESWKNFPHGERHKKVLTPEEVSKQIINKIIIKKKFLLTIPLRARLIMFGKNIFYNKYLKAVSKLPR